MMGFPRHAAHFAHLLVAAATLLAAGPSRAIDAQIDVNQASGVAPLAVFFDARATGDAALTPVQDFLDASYTWEFGDTACEASFDLWIPSGRSKCRDLGPLAGHVYETPGSYTATLVVEYKGIPISTRTVQITVDDPDVVFAGGKTVCVSRSGDFSDPNGVCDTAQQVTSSGEFASLLAAHFGPGVRMLFRRGESWAATGEFRFTGAGDAIVGAFGTGPKPVVTTGTQHMFNFGANNDGLRVMDLEIRGSDNQKDGSFFYTSSNGQGRNALALRVDVIDLAKPFLLGVNGGPTPGTGYMNNGMAIVDSTTSSRPWDSGNNDFFGGGERMIFMGNDFGDAEGTEHTLRFQYLKGAVVSHNSIGRNKPKDKHVIKMHNIFDSNPCTEEVVLADNRADAGGAGNALDLGPQNDSSVNECVRLVRVERNYVRMSGSTSHRQILIRGGDNLVANNILDLSGANPDVRPFGILVGKRASAQTQAASNNRILNNTCYMSNGGLGAKCVAFSGSGNGSVALNNLIYAPSLAKGDAVPVEDLGSGNTKAANVEATTNPFTTASPRFVGDFELGAGATNLIDQGVATPSLLPSDFSAEAGSRTAGASIDIGAYEDRGAASSLPEAPILLPD